MALPVSSLTVGAGASAPVFMESAEVILGYIVRVAIIIPALRIERVFFIFRQFVECSSL